MLSTSLLSSSFFFFNVPPTAAIYTLSLHDALPIFPARAHQLLRDRLAVHQRAHGQCIADASLVRVGERNHFRDRKSTRLNSSHSQISYAVFCLKKKKK